MARRKRRSATARIKWWLVPPLAILFVVPGMTAIGAIDELANLNLYPLQLWTFAILAAGVFYGIVSAVVRSLTGGLGIYAGISAGVLLLLLVAVLGFRRPFPIEWVGRFFGLA